ncbi:hypothetical protein, partial [Streptomyces hirsutus]|uniref:hypothetical protein n=1 Tax=Streptomyces hirsutus TaxID=35620 RepID=UPI0019815FE5
MLSLLVNKSDSFQQPGDSRTYVEALANLVGRTISSRFTRRVITDRLRNLPAIAVPGGERSHPATPPPEDSPRPPHRDDHPLRHPDQLVVYTVRGRQRRP